MVLPSKKIIFIACACILAVGGIYFALNPAVFQKQSAQTGGDVNLKVISEPKNNTPYEDQTLNNYLATSTISPALAKNASSSEQLSATDLFARQFFSEYLRLKSQGITMDAAAQQQVIQNTLNNGNFPIPSPKVYTTINFNAIAQNDDVSLHDYGNKLGKAMIDSSPKQKHDNEFEIFNKALTSQDSKEIAQIDPIVNGYIALLKEYVTMPVPSSALNEHLALVNSISAVLTDEKALQGVFNDPIVAYARLSKFPSDSITMKTAIHNLQTFLNQRGVTFEQNEYGYIFLHSI